MFWPGGRTPQKTPAGLCPLLRPLPAVVCLASAGLNSFWLVSSVMPGIEERPLELPVADSRDFWENLRVRHLKGQRSKSEMLHRWGLTWSLA